MLHPNTKGLINTIIILTANLHAQLVCESLGSYFYHGFHFSILPVLLEMSINKIISKTSQLLHFNIIEIWSLWGCDTHGYQSSHHLKNANKLNCFVTK